MSSNKMSWHFHRKIWFSDGFLVPFLILPQAGDEVQNFSFAEQPFWTSKRARHFFHVVITWPSLYRAKVLTHSRARARFKFFCEKAASARAHRRSTILRQISIFQTIQINEKKSRQRVLNTKKKIKTKQDKKLLKQNSIFWSKKSKISKNC